MVGPEPPVAFTTNAAHGGQPWQSLARFTSAWTSHKDHIAVAHAGTAADVVYVGLISTREADLDKLLGRLRGHAGRCVVAYEAGPCGYGLYRTLTAKGVPCHVLAPSLIPKQPGDPVKTDRRDAVQLARLLRAGELTPVYVPSVEDEAVRDLARARVATIRTQKAAKLRLKSFLLRLGLHYTGRATWNAAHVRRLVVVKPARFVNPHFASLDYQGLDHAVLDRIVHTWQPMAAARPLETLHLRARLPVCFNDDFVEAIVDVGTDGEDLGAVKPIDAPIPLDLMRMVGIRSGEVEMGATKRVSPNSEWVIIGPVRTLWVAETA